MDSLNYVDFDLVEPGNTPRAAFSRGVEAAGGAGSGAGTVDCVVFHKSLVLGSMFIRSPIPGQCCYLIPRFNSLAGARQGEASRCQSNN